MMKFHKILIFSFFVSATLTLDAQKIYKEAKIDSINQLSAEQLKAFVDAGNDMNEILYSEEDSEYYSTVYTEVAHSYGFYCVDDTKELIYYILMNFKNPIQRPFFFLDDACSERKSDILEYFKLLKQYNHGVTQEDFETLYNFYYQDVNYVNELGKTALMYACEFDYKNMVKRILKDGAKAKTEDSNGKTAFDYCTSDECRRMLQKARK